MLLALGQVPADSRRTTPAAARPEAVRLPQAADRIYRFVKLRKPGELNWQQVPWLTDLSEAVRQAKAENRPLLIFAAGDEPLEQC